MQKKRTCEPRRKANSHFPIKEKKLSDITQETDSSLPLDLRARRQLFLRRQEPVVWLFVAIIFLVPLLLDMYEYDFVGVNSRTQSLIWRENYAWLLLSFFVAMFPVVFRMVFGRFPFETLRRRMISDEVRWVSDSFYVPTTASESASVRTATDDQIRPTQHRDTQDVIPETHQSNVVVQTAEQLLFELSASSMKLSKDIYGRSGVYLFVGVMVAFSGLAFFYLQTAGALETKDITALMISLAPKFGILFFIEFVAFFFLRQYRASMEEFRYFEAIKRRREETLVLVKLGAEQSKPVDAFELVKIGQFFSSAGRLTKDETTEVLEARKLEKNETAVLEKAIDVIAQARKK